MTALSCPLHVQGDGIVRILVGLAIALATPAHAQVTRGATPGAEAPAATVSQLGWLIGGTWTGKGIKGAPASETYSPIQGGGIAGHFIQADDKGGIAFYELIQIVPRGQSLAYRLRHFNADLTGWEDARGGKAVEFPLVAIERDAAHFDGLSIVRTGPDAMTVTVRVGHKDGTSSELAFPYTRKR